MDIHNVTEFRNFIVSHNLNNLNNAFDGIVKCLMDYERGCNCWRGNARQKIYDNCKVQYAQIIPVVNQFAAHFLAHADGHGITFFQDGAIIGTVRR